MRDLQPTHFGQRTEKPPRNSLIVLVCLLRLCLCLDKVASIWDTSSVVPHGSEQESFATVIRRRGTYQVSGGRLFSFNHDQST